MAKKLEEMTKQEVLELLLAALENYAYAQGFLDENPGLARAVMAKNLNLAEIYTKRLDELDHQDPLTTSKNQ